MKQFIFLHMIFGLALMACACHQDKGLYDYADVNKVVIDLGNNGFLGPKTSDTLHINPLLIYRGDTTLATHVSETFTFIWYCNGEEISRNPQLVYAVRELTGKRPYVKLKVINKADESTFLAGFYVDAVPEYQTGWVVLTKKENRGIISFIDPDTYVVTADFYTTIAQEELGPNAIAVKEHWMAGGGLTNTGNILIVRNDPAGNIELDGTNLGPIYNTNNFFLGNVLPDDFRPRGEFYMWDYSFMLDDNGNVYTRKHENNAYAQSGVYPNKPMFIPSGVKFHKGWSGTHLSGQTIFYDQTNGSLYLGTDHGFVLPINYMSGPPIPPGTTLIHAMDKELAYVGKLQQGRFTSSYFLFFRDDTGQHYVQKIQVMDQYYTCAALFFSEKPFGVGTATPQSIFCQLQRIENYLFYSGGTNNNTLYLYEHSQAQSSAYFTFDAPIKTIAARQNSVMGVTTHDQLLVGLENGDTYVLGILSEQMANPAARLIKRIELDQGVPVSSMYKVGFGYTQL
ncbi:PKD-like family lipoprotein [Parapedobacter tibetensis]|uniref:PKD-like family lipoprotein n=1 Tax=Parapedobacter tibetensis TaxID=2972951 RepID=UPI00214D7A47|nr:PKD-like family lipoprotein [Parapedobacter tibetensis]